MENKNEICYGILMNRIPIDYGIYLFKPEYIVEGNVAGNYEIPRFIDIYGTEYYTISDADALDDNSLVIGYIISKSQLLEKFGKVPIDEAKFAYFNHICEKTHIGFYIMDKGKFVVGQLDLLEMHRKLNESDMDINNETIQFCNGSIMQDNNLNTLLEEYDGDEIIAISFEEFERILNIEDLSKMKEELETVYKIAKEMNAYFLNGDTLEQKVEMNDITGEYIKKLFNDCYETLLSIDDLNEMKDAISKIEEVYIDLTLLLDEKCKLGYNVEEANNLIYSLVERYDLLLQKNNLNEIKNEIEKLSQEEAKRIESLALKIEQLRLDKEIGNEQKDSQNSKSEVDSLLSELNQLIGLDNIKNHVNVLIKYLIYLDKVKNHLNIDKLNLHMFFSGNSGTGKTTVARILSKLLYQLGYLKNNKIAEITAKDLIAEFVGQTGPKAARVIKENRGGLIFIDEAYVFSSDAQRFAQEAIVEILKEMEKNDTIFIFAGYKDEMKQFLELNPGLKSRIGYYFDYEDYTIEELLQIFKLKVENAKLKLNDDVSALLIPILEKAKLKKNFGNGRFVENLFYKILAKHAENTEYITELDPLLTIQSQDISPDIEKELMLDSEIKNIGFQKVK